MNKHKCYQVVTRYTEALKEYDDGPLGHCKNMLPKMSQFLEENRIEKFFRWLGFVQGVLWSERLYTIEELKDHNRPDDETL